MEFNRYRARQNKPYHQGRTEKGRDHYRPYNSRGSSRPHERKHYNNYNNHRQYQERTFDNRGREVLPNPRYYRHGEDTRDKEEFEPSAAVPHLTPLEEKAKNLLHTVLNQQGIRSQLIFLETVENSLQTLQGTVDYNRLLMTVDQISTGEFVLKIGSEELARGSFPTKQIAKSALAEQVMDILKKDCFYIIKKKVYEEVSTKPDDSKEEDQGESSLTGSKAHQMMLKMGWGGKGLGINEQGVEKTVAETIDQNVSRQGLGSDDVFKKIHKLLEDYSKSDKMSLLRFDPDFTSDERAHIHTIAKRLGLKSKSEGKGEQRRITITKKLHREDLVYNLLTCGLENVLYKLIIPEKFQYLWQEEEDDDADDDSYHPHFSN